MESKVKISREKICDWSEQWCNRKLKLGCKISNCMRDKVHPDECNRMRRELEECIRDKKTDILKTHTLN